MRTTAPLLSLLLLATAISTADAQAGSPAAERFTVDRAIDMTRVGNPELSPDGRRVLFTRTELNWDDNDRLTRLWIANANGSDARPYTAEKGDGSPQWSPDGRWIAFARSADDDDDDAGSGRQIWLIRTDGGEARQLTHHATSVRAFQWTPDARRLVFIAADSVPKKEKDERKDGYDAVIVDEGPNGQSRGSWSNLWWVPADFDDADARPITSGERIVGDFDVDPAGERVAFTFRTEDRRNDEFRSEIAVVGMDGGEIRELTHNEAPESGLRWTPDGTSLLFVAPSLETWTLDQGNLYFMDPATGDTRQLLADSDLDIRVGGFTRDGRFLDFTATDGTVTNFYRLDLRRGEVRPMSQWRGVVGSASWSRDHERVAFTFETPTSPPEVYTSAFNRRMERTAVTDVGADIRELALAEPEVVQWTSTDGLPVEGILYPALGDRSAPGAFVLHIHGGPAGGYTLGFNPDAQILAAHGFAVLEPNVRGSTGYGDDLLRGNVNDIGGGDFQDLMSGVDAMIERGVADPDSMAVKGWSYGGILGGWTITQTDRFKAASLGAMVADWPGEFGVGFNYDVTRWYLGGDPWSNRAFWIERSAFYHADQIHTPTILFHGDEDSTDTPGQSMNFHAALSRFGVPNRLIRFPREPHGFREPRHQRTRMVEELRWFEQYVRGNPDWQAPERAGKEDAKAANAGA